MGVPRHDAVADLATYSYTMYPQVAIYALT